MTIQSVAYQAAPGGTYYAFPLNQSLASWMTYRVQLGEATAPNQGRYSADLDDAVAFSWVVFSGTSQPTNWGAGVADIELSRLDNQFSALTATGVTLISPFTADGTLNPIIIGDDYNIANGRSFKWELDAIPGFTAGTATCKFGAKNARNEADAFLVTGTTTDIGSGRWRAEVELDKADTENLPPGKYNWSVEVVQSGEEITIARNAQERDRVELATKQT